jgi:2'-5' RNA ligase
MRLFIAIDFNEHHDYLAELQGTFKPIIKASFPRSFHLTLKFLGEVPEGRLDRIKQALHSVEFQPMKLNLGSLGAFPKPNSPRVIWVSVKPDQEVITLQKKIENSLSALFPPDTRFHPHITLARVKSIRDKEKLKTALSHQVEPKEAELASFELIKSVLTPQGPLYETVSRFSAKGL